MGQKVLKVLIVEDESEYSGLLVQALEGVDRFVVVGVTGSEFEAYHLINERLPDIVIVDLMLDEGDGAAFLEEINRNAKCMPRNFYTVAVSSYLARYDAPKLKQLADAVYSKHTNPDVSSLVVNHLISKAETIARRAARKKLNQPRNVEKPKSLKLPRFKKVSEKLEDPMKTFIRYDKQRVKERVSFEIDQYETSDWLSVAYLKRALFLVVLQQEYKQFGPRRSNKLMEKIYAELSYFFQKEPAEIQTKMVALLRYMFKHTAVAKIEKLYGKPVKQVGTREFLIKTARKVEEQLQNKDT